MINRLDWSITGLALKRNVETNSRGPIASRTRQGLLEQHNGKKRNKCPRQKRRLCYTCRLKGHLSQDCPNGNKSKSKLVNSTISMCGKIKNGKDAPKVISSPYGSIKTIWVPKFFLTNLQGPNKTWVLKLT
jgi:hypothetical protein